LTLCTGAKNEVCLLLKFVERKINRYSWTCNVEPPLHIVENNNNKDACMTAKLITHVNTSQVSSVQFMIDLVIYFAIMFLIREVYFEGYHFLVSGLFWSSATLIAAIAFMRMRKVNWSEIGLNVPKSFKQATIATVFIFAFSVGSIVIFQTIKNQLGLEVAQDLSDEQAVSKFGELENNWTLFFMLIPFVWLQSALEEILDRGFLINWFERAMANAWFATIVAVIIQAIVFGFRHSYDLSERSITVGLIGLGMGIGYVAFGRNLWPLIIAHCVLNTMSFVGRV